MPDRYVLIYDGHCRICLRSVEWVRRRAGKGLIETLPYQDPSSAKRFPDIPRERMEGAMQLVAPDGERFEGAGAAERLLKVLPGTGWMGVAFRIPGARRVAERVYRAVARNRHRFGCGDHCAVADSAGERV